jgi:hypothetical protein
VTLKVISEEFLDDELAQLCFLRTASAVRVGKYGLHILFSQNDMGSFEETRKNVPRRKPGLSSPTVAKLAEIEELRYQNSSAS